MRQRLNRVSSSTSDRVKLMCRILQRTRTFVSVLEVGKPYQSFVEQNLFMFVMIQGKELVMNMNPIDWLFYLVIRRFQRILQFS